MLFSLANRSQSFHVVLFVLFIPIFTHGESLAAFPVRSDDCQASSTQPNFDAIESIVEQGIKDGKMPGAVVVIADRERVLYRRAFGQRQVKPIAERMTGDTVFELASLTKPIATATSIMKLIGEGQLSPQSCLQKLFLAD